MDPTRTLAALPTATSPAEPGGERTHIARAVDAGTPAADELRTLLRKRLRFVGVVLSVVYLTSAAFSLFVTVNRAHYVPVWFVTGVAILFTAILWSRTRLTLPQLRAAELVLFGLAAGQQAFEIPWALTSVNTRAGAGAVNIAGIGLFANLNWFALVVGYGVLIPNTGRRCALIVGVFAVVPVVIYLGSGLAIEEVRDRHRTVLVVSAFFFAVYMAVAASVAVYGSHRIETLRRQAAAARRLGQYELKEKLGGGGMGEVYRADHALLRRPAAIKLIRPEKAGDPATLARFEREVQATATLTHPNTVAIYDYGRADDGTFYYVMEYLDGITLDDLVKRAGPLPPARAVHFLRQLCGALAEAHRIGLVHRDIKPGNVMVCDRGGVPDTIKLLDFGLVLPVGTENEKLTHEGTWAGTPAFLSPEQAGGQDAPDARSDVYSLGALAYFLLTGEPPFAGRPAIKMIAAHLYEQPAPPSVRRPGVPADLDAIVLKCLEKSPTARFPDVGTLEDALGRCATTSAGPAER